MSPKVAKAAKPAAKPAKIEKKAAAPAKAVKADAKADKGAKAAAKPAKGGKAAAATETTPPTLNPDGSPVDLDELEEQQDAAAASSTSGGGNAAAIAAAGGGTEMSASFKNFRHHPDMENFYRFIYENDLRHEALAIIDAMLKDKAAKKAAKHAHK